MTNHVLVGELPKAMGYSLQANRKTPLVLSPLRSRLKFLAFFVVVYRE